MNWPYLSPSSNPPNITLDHGTEYALMGLSTALVILSILFAWFRFKTYREAGASMVAKLLENKRYVDEIYDAVLFVR